MDRVLFMLGCAFIGQLTFRVSPSLTLSDAFFLAALVVLLVKVSFGKRRIFRVDSYFLTGAALVFVGALTTAFFIESQVEHLIVLSKFIFSSVVIVFLSRCLIINGRDAKNVLISLGFSGALNGLGALAQLFVDPAIIPNTQTHYGRMTGFTQHVNDLGSSTAMMLVPLLLISLSANKWPTRFIGFSFLGVMACGLMLSGSLSSIVSVALGLLFVLIVSNLKPYQKASLVLVPLMLSILVLSFERNDLSMQVMLDRVFSGGATYDSTASQRLLSYQASFEAILDEPFTGVGLKSGGSRTDAGIAVHNVFLIAWYEMGLLGALGIAVILIGSFLKVLMTKSKAISKSNNDVRLMVIGMQGAMLCFGFYCMTAPALIQRHLWIVVGVALAIAKLAGSLNSQKVGGSNQGEVLT